MKTLFESIPPSQALGIEVAAWDGQRVDLTAPRARNLNDTGTAVAGSIDSLLDLAGRTETEKIKNGFSRSVFARRGDIRSK